MEIFAYLLLIYLLAGLWCTAVSKFKPPEDGRVLMIVGWLWPILVLMKLHDSVTKWL